MNRENPIIQIYHSERHTNTRIGFIDILLDETLITGTIYVPRICLRQVSTLNSRLPARQIYEFLLRLALIYPVCLSDTIPDGPDTCLILECQETAVTLEGLQTDCYIVARYRQVLLEQQLFDAAVSSILASADRIGCREQLIPFLEAMLKKQHPYPYFFQGSQPFLIYTGDTICYQILSVFARCLGEALQKQGYQVEYFDLSKETHAAISRYIGQSFQAVIGMQTYLFSIRLKDGRFLHDSIDGPKYNFIFDHPVWMREYLKAVPEHFTVFTLDRNYPPFIQKYYPVRAKFFPPGGMTGPSSDSRRIYDLTFVGSYINNAEEISVELKLLSRPMRFLVNRFWMNMRRFPEQPAEHALFLALNHSNQNLTDTEFLDLFYSLRKFILYMSYHFRYQLIKAIVDSGIRLHVFGNTWESCPLRSNPNLIWHEADLSAEECLTVWQQSRLTLNMMSWHKDAITERIANSMLQKTAVLTEHNPYLEEQYQDGRDIIFYSLKDLHQVPEQIRTLLASPEYLTAVGEHGYEKTVHTHTWDCRAERLIKIAQADAGG